MRFNEKFSREEIISNIEEFKKIYDVRIIKDQQYGMRSPQLFGAWFMLKKLNPKYVIESGVWKGLGTWFFEKILPHSEIFSIDPDLNKREYISPKVKYFSEDFSTIDWSHINPSETVVFFDDHQNALERVKTCQRLGFKKLIFEDNYPRSQGDCYSLKKIISKKDYSLDSGKNKIWKSHSEEDFKFLKQNLIHYQEFPPIFKDIETRWGEKWDDCDYESPEALLDINNVADKYLEFYEERKSYTWICYAEII